MAETFFHSSCKTLPGSTIQFKSIPSFRSPSCFSNGSGSGGGGGGGGVILRCSPNSRRIYFPSYGTQFVLQSFFWGEGRFIPIIS